MTPDLAVHDEVGQLRRTIVAMRSELGAAPASQQEAVQKAITSGHSEIMERRDTIRALRDQLEQERVPHAKDTYRVLNADRVVVKGKTEPVGVFEVLDYHTEESFPNLKDFLGYYRNGITTYRRQQWDKAIAAFRQSLKLRPNKLTQIHVERSEEMKEQPPGDDWNGVSVLKSK